MSWAVVHEYPPGTYVQGINGDWIGTVERLAVNVSGEPCLVVNMVKRRFLDDKGMFNLDWKPIDEINEFWERTGLMHPLNLTKLKEGTLL